MFVQHACGLTITADTICVMLKQAFGLYHIEWSIDRRFWVGGSGNMKIPFQKKMVGIQCTQTLPPQSIDPV